MKNLNLLVEKVKEIFHELFNYGLYFSLGLVIHWFFWGKPVWFTVTTFIALFLWPLVIIYELFWYIVLTAVIFSIIIFLLVILTDDVDDYGGHD
jgi:hypothetical protein